MRNPQRQSRERGRSLRDQVKASGLCQGRAKLHLGWGISVQPVQDTGDIPQPSVCGRVTEIPKLNTEKEFFGILNEMQLMFRLTNAVPSPGSCQGWVSFVENIQLLPSSLEDEHSGEVQTENPIFHLLGQLS